MSTNDADKTDQVDNADKVLQPELPENIDVVSPGIMLREAREKLSLTQKEVAQRLNFRQILIEKIENDDLDLTLSDTFNRGYLRSYARLVHVNVEDVLAAFDVLRPAQDNQNEMQSFSHITVNETEKSRLIWVSYLILAILFGLTILWWLQDAQQQVKVLPLNEEKSAEQIKVVKSSNDAINQKKELPQDNAIKASVETKKEIETAENTTNIDDSSITHVKVEKTESISTSAPVLNNSVQLNNETLLVEPEQVQEASIGHAVFTFSGDCWVNIYDATGERIAWGVKKSGYVMTIEGVEPLRITLGKPELATILYNGQAVDLSSFNIGNIAKFSLPMNP